jgi:hypothetical protein
MKGAARPGRETELENPVNEEAEKSASFFLFLDRHAFLSFLQILLPCIGNLWSIFLIMHS